MKIWSWGVSYFSRAGLIDSEHLTGIGLARACGFHHVVKNMSTWIYQPKELGLLSCQLHLVWFYYAKTA